MANSIAMLSACGRHQNSPPRNMRVCIDCGELTGEWDGDVRRCYTCKTEAVIRRIREARARYAEAV